MKTTLLERCKNLESELRQQCEESETCSIADVESNLLGLLDQLAANGDKDLAQDLRTNVTTLVLRARLHKARAEALADHVGGDFLAVDETMQSEVENIRKEVEGTNAHDEAAIAINRSVHQTSGTFKEIVKGLLMWVDTPEEVLKNKRTVDKELIS